MPARAQVLGLDTIRTKDVRETHRLVCAHIARVRRIKNLQDSTIVLCLECARPSNQLPLADQSSCRHGRGGVEMPTVQ